MAHPQINRSRMTPEEYFAFEEKSEIRHEYVGGHVIALAGGSFEHWQIKSNTEAALRDALHGRGCIVGSSDLKIQAVEEQSYRLPDVVVLCAEPDFLPGRRDTVVNPTMLVEVLSESSTSVDRGAKWREYLRIPSLRAYLVIDQHSPAADVLTRDSAEGIIRYTFAEGLDNSLSIDSLEITLALAMLYEGVSFDPDTPETDDEASQQ